MQYGSTDSQLLWLSMTPSERHCHDEAVHICCMLPRVQSLLAPNGVNQYGIPYLFGYLELLLSKQEGGVRAAG